MYFRCSRPRVTWLGLLLLIFSGSLPANSTPTGGYSIPFLPKTTLSDTLTFAVSLEKVLQYDPGIRGASANLDAALAYERVASKLPDPRLELESEDLSSSGPEIPIYTFSLIQLIELGGKRGARREVATRKHALAQIEAARTLTDIRSKVHIRYAEAVARQSSARASQASLELARATVEAISVKVDVGERPFIDLARAQIAFADATIEYRQAELDKNAAFSHLASLWGSIPEFSVVSETQPFQEVLDLSSLLELLNSSALSQSWEAELAIIRSQLAVEASQRVPDITLSTGLRKYETTGSKTAVVKLSLAIPLFNGNRARTAAARFQVFGAEAYRDEVSQLARIQVIEAHRKASSINVEVAVLKDEILPKAETVAALMKEGYQEGKFSLLELLDAQYVLARSRARLANAILEYQISTAELARLIEPATFSTN